MTDEGAFTTARATFGDSTSEATLALTPTMDLTPEHYAAIGAIAARWTWLEHQLGVLIREGFGLDKKEGRILTGGMAMKPKCNILRIMALKWTTDATLRDELTNLTKNCLKMIDDRNNHVHGLYAHPNGNPSLIGLVLMDSGEQRYRPDFKAPILPELQRIAADLRALQERAQAITRQMKARPK